MASGIEPFALIALTVDNTAGILIDTVLYSSLYAAAVLL